MLTLPTTPSRHKDSLHASPNDSPNSSLKSKSSSSSIKSKHTGSSHSPGKLVKKVKRTLRRISDHVTHHNHKQRGAAGKGLAAVVPLTTTALLGPVGGPVPLGVAMDDDDAPTPKQQQRPSQQAEANDWCRSRAKDSLSPWEEEKSDKHVARRSRSLSFISNLLPRTRTSSRASAFTAAERSISDSVTLASQEHQAIEDKGDLKPTVGPLQEPPQHYLVVVEESAPEEEAMLQEPVESGKSKDEPSGETLIPSEHAAMEETAPEPSLTPTNSESASVPELATEPEVPNPFLVDEEGDALSEEERRAAEASTEASSEPEHDNAPAQEISLAVQDSTAPVSPSALPPRNLNKDVPPVPLTESQKEDAPELFLPALIAPTMFLPIPNTDPLTNLLSKYIYPPETRPVRDLTGEWHRNDFHTLVMTNSWRALARMARDRLVTTNPEDLNMVLNLWYIRLSCLARLRLFNQTSAECTNLFAVLIAVEPVEARIWLFDNALPFELEVMHARLKYWAGDHMGYLDALYALLQKCRAKARQAGREAAALAAARAGAGISFKSVDDGSTVTAVMWKERGVRMCLIIASQLMEMKEYAAATKLLEPLCEQKQHDTEDRPNTSVSALRSSIGRMYLQAGNLHMAARHFAAAAKDPAAEPAMKEMNSALFACADGQWERASETLRKLLERDAENYVAVSNMAVALLGQGKVSEGISTLEAALQTSPSSVVVAEPFLFNLSTLYELRFAGSIDKKRGLLIEVAKWSGDGLKATCLKLPAN
ncbi:hypothetical protein AX17_004185 [Amanita inopinata Kibby_2008]|nr:hypothetical protein AX17_004185 [Amanita inopinata Kibby_2008]